MLPTSQIETQSGLATYAQPYVESMLGATMQNLFNVDPSTGQVQGLRGYQPYSMRPEDYVAAFSPLQEQAMQGIAGLSAPRQTEMATNYMNDLIGRASNVQYTPTSTGYDRVRSQSIRGPGMLESYMSPYMQNVVDAQQQQAKRQAAIANQTLQAQAARAGAFGGSGAALQRAQANAELQRNLQGIQAMGSQNAFQQAQQQFNVEQQARMQAALANQQARQASNQLRAQQQQFGAGLGLQGLQAAMGGASQLGNLGTQQLQNQLGIFGAQSQAGAQQQALNQRVIDQAVQNYNTAQQYPYMQLGFMQNMLGGLPISTSSRQEYQAAPSLSSQLLGAGTALIGANQMLGGNSRILGGTGTQTGGGSAGSTLGQVGGIASGLNNLYNTGKNIVGGVTDFLGSIFAEGGEVKQAPPPKKNKAPMGLQALALSKI